MTMQSTLCRNCATGTGLIAKTSHNLYRDNCVKCGNNELVSTPSNYACPRCGKHDAHAITTDVEGTTKHACECGNVFWKKSSDAK